MVDFDFLADKLEPAKGKQANNSKKPSSGGGFSLFKKESAPVGRKRMILDYAGKIKEEKSKRTEAAPKKRGLFSQSIWSTTNVIKTNLIKNEVTTFINWDKHLSFLVIYIIFALLVMSLSYGGLMFWERRVVQVDPELQAELSQIDLEIKSREVDKMEIDSFEKKLTLVRRLLENHVYWSNFFAFLEEYTLPNVQYASGFSGNTSGDYSLSAKTDSYRSMADQIKVFESADNVISVTVTGGTMGIEQDKLSDYARKQVNFQILLKISSELFLK